MAQIPEGKDYEVYVKEEGRICHTDISGKESTLEEVNLTYNVCAVRICCSVECILAILLS